MKRSVFYISLLSILFAIFYFPGNNPNRSLLLISHHVCISSYIAQNQQNSYFPIFLAIPLKILSHKRKGVFLIEANSSIFNILKKIYFRKHYRLKTYIPVGTSNNKIMEKIARTPGLISAFPEQIPEGSMLSATYTYTYGTTRQKFIKHTQESLIWMMNSLWEKYQQQTQLENAEQAHILASIVVKEAELEEYEKIAGVFLNRIKLNMALNACSTILFLTNRQRVMYKDLKIDSPYNTYLNKGLPPGPIASVSKEALEAVLKSSNLHHYVYFVKHPTLPKIHNFSVKPNEHIKHTHAYKKYQRM